MADRRRLGDTADNTDLLGLMLTGVDKQSGETLPDDNIVAQCLTFLVAGHETTSGLLSFAIYYLLKNPQYAQQGAGRGGRSARRRRASPTTSRCTGSRYVRQILDETLRLWPTAPMFTRTPLQDTVVGEQVRLPEGHRAVGAGADAAPGPQRVGRRTPRSSTPTNSRRSGSSRCRRRRIGRSAPACAPASGASSPCRRRRSSSACCCSGSSSSITATTSCTPVDADRQARRFLDQGAAAHRPGRSAASRRSRAADRHRGEAGAESDAAPGRRAAHGTPLLVLFGSNLGTAEGIANQLGREGSERGYQVTVAALDDHGADLPTQGAVLIVCSSYNGEPPENAIAFVGRLAQIQACRRAFAGRVVHGLRLRRHRLGRNVSGRAEAAGHRAGTARRAPDPSARRGQRARRLRRSVPRVARRPLGRRRLGAAACRSSRPRRRRPVRGCRSRWSTGN